MSKTRNLQIAALSVISAAALFAFLLMFVFVCYVMMSYWQKNDPPADYDISVPKQAYAGSIIPFDVINIYRHKVCPYKRIISIVDSQGSTYNNQELVGYPAGLLGKNLDIHLSILLDKKIAPGMAQFNVVIEYICPGNFFHAVLNDPFVQRWSFPLNMLTNGD